MVKLQIQQLNSYIHLFKRQIRTSDLNYTSRLDHTSLIKMVHDARVDCFKQFGFSERNLIPKSEIPIHSTINEIQAQYLNDAELDEELYIESDFIEKTKYGFRMSHRIKLLQPFGPKDILTSNLNNNNNNNNNNNSNTASGTTFKNIALIEIGITSINPITKTPVELPEVFFKNIGLKDKDQTLVYIKKQ